MPKKTIPLNHNNVEYTNSLGQVATADFREVDAKTAWLNQVSRNEAAQSASGRPVARVFRVSSEGENLLARFYHASTGKKDADDFAALMNRNYAVLGGFYKAEVRIPR